MTKAPPSLPTGGEPVAVDQPRHQTDASSEAPPCSPLGVDPDAESVVPDGAAGIDREALDRRLDVLFQVAAILRNLRGKRKDENRQ